MALVQRTTLARFRFRDNDGAESTCEINIPVGVALGSALSWTLNMRSLVAALSSATCIELLLIARWVETTPASAGSSSDAGRLGSFVLTTVSDDYAIVRVPSIAAAYLATTAPAAGIRIDSTLGAVAALVNALVSGLGGIAPCDPFGVDLIELYNAFKEQQ